MKVAGRLYSWAENAIGGMFAAAEKTSTLVDHLTLVDKLKEKRLQVYHSIAASEGGADANPTGELERMAQDYSNADKSDAKLLRIIMGAGVGSPALLAIPAMQNTVAYAAVGIGAGLALLLARELKKGLYELSLSRESLMREDAKKAYASEAKQLQTTTTSPP